MMKNITINVLLFFCGSILCWSACKKNELRVSPYDLTDGKGLLKINYSCPYFASTQGVMVKINDVVYSSLITYSTPYPGGGLNTGGNSYADYLSVSPGQNTVSLIIPIPGTSIPDRVLYTTVANVTADVYQTLHITDTGANTKSVMTIDPSVRPDSGFVLYRFVNLIPNSTGIDLYFDTTKATRLKLASNIGYLEQSDTFSLPAGTSLYWGLTKPGNDTILAGSAYISSSTVANQRVFTIYSRGYLGLPATDIRCNKISFEYNK